MIEQEHGRVREVGGEDPVQLARSADARLGLVAGRGRGGDVLRHEVHDAVLDDPRPVDQAVVAVARAQAILEGEARLLVRRLIPRCRLDVIGMHEREERLGHQLLE